MNFSNLPKEWLFLIFTYSNAESLSKMAQSSLSFKRFLYKKSTLRQLVHMRDFGGKWQLEDFFFEKEPFPLNVGKSFLSVSLLYPSYLQEVLVWKKINELKSLVEKVMTLAERKEYILLPITMTKKDFKKKFVNLAFSDIKCFTFHVEFANGDSWVYETREEVREVVEPVPTSHVTRLWLAFIFAEVFEACWKEDVLFYSSQWELEYFRKDRICLPNCLCYSFNFPLIMN